MSDLNLFILRCKHIKNIKYLLNSLTVHYLKKNDQSSKEMAKTLITMVGKVNFDNWKTEKILALEEDLLQTYRELNYEELGRSY